MKRHWAMFWMGAWLLGTVAMWLIATQNFYTVDRLFEFSSNMRFHTLTERLGRAETRELLRYLSSELNRLYFQLWNIFQLGIGILALWFVVKLPGSQRTRWGIVAMLGVVLLMMVWVTPQILFVGRGLDFVPRDPSPPGLRTFGLLHTAYTVLDLFKFIMGVIVTVWIHRISLTA